MSPKEQGVPSPEKPHKPEEHTGYLRASHFIDGLASQQVYMDIQSKLRTAQEQGEGYFHVYNHVRLHQSLQYRTPAEVHFA